jgi:hypothetical protein
VPPPGGPPPARVPVRVLVALPLLPSAIPLPGAPVLPPEVTHAVAVVTRAAPGAAPLRSVVEAAAAAAGGDAARRLAAGALTPVLHGVAAEDAPGMLDAPVGDVARDLCHPDGFLYIARRAAAAGRAA